MIGNNQYEKIDNETIIKRFINIHGDRYDYSKVEYKSMHTPVCIICYKHGEFFMTPHNHLKGQNCNQCVQNEKSLKEKEINKNKFINESTEKFNGKFDYSKVNYVNNKTKVTILCPIHGEIQMTPYDHLHSKFGCKKCAVEYIGQEKIKNNKMEFKRKADIIHNGKHDYSNVSYNGVVDSIEIICPIHGKFIQNKHDHLQGCGCPKCGIRLSNSENDLYEYIKTYYSNVIHNDRNILKPYELDIYIPDKKIAIEYDGLVWHSEKYDKDKNYHLNKTLECERQGIRLIHIFEDEWLEHSDIIKSMLNNVFGITNKKIFARKCEIKKVIPAVAMEFLKENHIQGMCKAKYHYGLYHNNELVSLMTFGKTRQQRKFNDDYDNTWELLRFCNKLNTSVVGGASKLLKHFIDEVKPNKIITYADKRWSIGNLYKKLGFTHTHDSRPNYFYVVGQHRENRFKYRKGELVKQGFDSSKSEHEIMLERKMYRIYDCGTMVFEMTIE